MLLSLSVSVVQLVGKLVKFCLLCLLTLSRLQIHLKLCGTCVRAHSRLKMFCFTVMLGTKVSNSSIKDLTSKLCVLRKHMHDAISNRNTICCAEPVTWPLVFTLCFQYPLHNITNEEQ